MPIRPSERARYPSNWKAISLEIRARAGWHCEGSPDFPDCRAANGQPHPVTGSIVVLTVAHLDHTPENCEQENLRALCQKCHLNYDREHHIEGRRKRKEEERRRVLEVAGQIKFALDCGLKP